MMGFILISGILTTISNNIVGKIAKKMATNRGYAYQSEKNEREKIIDTCTNFIPYYNIFKAGAYMMMTTIFFLLNESEKKRMLESDFVKNIGIRKVNIEKQKEDFGNKEKKTKTVNKQIQFDSGKSELSIASSEVTSNNNEKKVDAMSETELWEQTLSTEEKHEYLEKNLEKHNESEKIMIKK